jgi:hypothetical protein
MDGGCLCEAIRYHVDGDPLMTGVCHCTHCQKQSGAAFSLFVMVPKQNFRLERGTPARFETLGESGNPVQRHFCRDCGSPLYSEAAIAPDFYFLKAGTLDERAWLKPTLHLFCDSAQPWVAIDESAKRFARGRPRKKAE